MLFTPLSALLSHIGERAERGFSFHRCFSALRNPGTFYYRNISNDWTAPHNADLWQEGTKTLFDPCPAGWRVPRSGEEDSGLNPWAAFTVANSIWTGTDVANPASGRRWRSPVVFGGEAWYPTACRRYYSSGNFQQGAGFCHTASIDKIQVSSAGHFVYAADRVTIFDIHSCAHAHSVRCLRE